MLRRTRGDEVLARVGQGRVGTWVGLGVQGTCIGGAGENRRGVRGVGPGEKATERRKQERNLAGACGDRVRRGRVWAQLKDFSPVPAVHSGGSHMTCAGARCRLLALATSITLRCSTQCLPRARPAQRRGNYHPQHKVACLGFAPPLHLPLPRAWRPPAATLLHKPIPSPPHQCGFGARTRPRIQWGPAKHTDPCRHPANEARKPSLPGATREPHGSQLAFSTTVVSTSRHRSFALAAVVLAGSVGRDSQRRVPEWAKSDGGSADPGHRGPTIRVFPAERWVSG